MSAETIDIVGEKNFKKRFRLLKKIWKQEITAICPAYWMSISDLFYTLNHYLVHFRLANFKFSSVHFENSEAMI